jgi:hypothetical protein
MTTYNATEIIEALKDGCFRSSFIQLNLQPDDIVETAKELENALPKIVSDMRIAETVAIKNALSMLAMQHQLLTNILPYVAQLVKLLDEEFEPPETTH